MEEYIKALRWITYFEWIKLRESINAVFEMQKGEFEKKLKLTDSENVKRIIRSRFGGKLD
jgi:hypothetical protein